MPRTPRLLATLATAATLVIAGAATSAPSAADDASSATAADFVALPGLSATLTGDATRGLATFDAPPTGQQVTALRALGLAVQPMEALPLAVVDGPTALLEAAVVSGVANDVYPDEVLDYTDTASSDVASSSPQAARKLRARGHTGKGVTVGVVDSGCDGTHPDLAERVVVNQILFSPEYANAGTSPIVPVPVDQGPYSNTDIGSGHGTHVGGIIAADGTSGPQHLGVAPDAKLACFGIGAVITTTAVVTAFDHILATPDHFDVDVVNNSWGNSFRQFDPEDPVNVASRALTREGITVVFSAGNSGAEDAEASMSPFNQAPWVIAVAASDLDRKRGDFSSNGLTFDNSRAVPIGPGGHTVHRGDRIGLVHPDISAPGVDISSSCDSTGTVIGPCPQHGNATASGTSMSSPHIAGAAAVVIGAQPRLSPRQVQQALYATASRMREGRKVVPFWQVGFGHVNVDRAVRLVTGRGWKQDLRREHRRAERRVLRADGTRVLRSDMWQYDAPPASAGGSDSATYRVRVTRKAERLHLTLVHPSTGLLTGVNAWQYTATLLDPSGREVATTTASLAQGHGTAVLDAPAGKPGRYTIEVSGDYAASDPDTIDSDSIAGRVVFAALSQLR